MLIFPYFREGVATVLRHCPRGIFPVILTACTAGEWAADHGSLTWGYPMNSHVAPIDKLQVDSQSLNSLHIQSAAQHT
jgi:hypothetical protein